MDKVREFIKYMHQAPKQWQLLRQCQLTRVRESRRGVADRSSHGLRGVDDQALPLRELEAMTSAIREGSGTVGKQSRVYSLISSVENRWASMYASLQRFYYLRGAIEKYYSTVAERASKDPDFAKARDKIAAWELTVSEWSSMGKLLQVLQVIAELQIMLEASD